MNNYRDPFAKYLCAAKSRSKKLDIKSKISVRLCELMEMSGCSRFLLIHLPADTSLEVYLLQLRYHPSWKSWGKGNRDFYYPNAVISFDTIGFLKLRNSGSRSTMSESLTSISNILKIKLQEKYLYYTTRSYKKHLID